MLKRVKFSASKYLFALPTKNISLLQQYQARVVQQHIQYDIRQVALLEVLQTLLDTVQQQALHSQKSTPQRLFSVPPPVPQSVYIYGSVGSGKSMLMDLFFHACPINAKRRVHFHAFMQEIHARLHILRQQNVSDVIKQLALEIRSATQLLCFDEFLVKDITDAMLLGRLFKQLFALDLIVVITSNYAPDNLYCNGLQRDLFIPFIQLLKRTVIIWELTNPQDYRVRHLLRFRQRYYFPLNEYADYLIHQSYTALTNDAPKKSGSIRLAQRNLKLTAAHGDVALSSFNELCAQPLGANDYLQLAYQFNTLILADIPKLTDTEHDAAQRFSVLIDVLYEHKIKFICSAEVPAEALYAMLENAVVFERTVSRLIEMQSENYLQQTCLKQRSGR